MADVVEILQRAGGSARYAELAALTSARSIRNALQTDEIRRVAKGVYALPAESSDSTVAMANGGILARQSAALHHGLEVVTKPLVPHVLISRTQRRRETDLKCVLHRTSGPLPGHVTTPLQTVLDCARHLPFGEALAVADSALRLRKVEPSELLGLAVFGWLLLRYSWEDVILDDHWVGTSLVAAVRRAGQATSHLAA
ncbi:hypothetical protein AB0P21_01020 [Kribbella sp. NPDC056861]|uniref:hypothetical protein n=1 Tax=Kribbella sp. NPDC056861 TaxID=3154857 RepID=UPI00342EE606